jgi:hypothetical protein
MNVIIVEKKNAGVVNGLLVIFQRNDMKPYYQNELVTIYHLGEQNV